MKNSMESLRSGLGAQLKEIDDELSAAAGRTRELKEARRRVAAALKALGDERGAQEARPAPKKQQVLQAVRGLLSDNGGLIPQADLEPLVTAKLSEAHGCSAVGLALRLREVLAAAEFVVAEGAVRLADPLAKKTSTPCQETTATPHK